MLLHQHVLLLEKCLIPPLPHRACQNPTSAKTTYIMNIIVLFCMCSPGPYSWSQLVLLDPSAVFNTINHGILLGWLSKMGPGGTVLDWLQSFLVGPT